MSMSRCSTCHAILPMNAAAGMPCPACSNLQGMLPDPAHAMRPNGSARRQAREDDDDDDAPTNQRSSGGSDAGKAAGVAGMGVGMMVLIFGGLAVCCLGSCGVGVALLLPAIQKVRGAADRVTRMNDLKQIGVGALNHNDTFQVLPSPQMQPQQPGGKAPDLSWRVSILPFVEENPLFNRFDKTQAWDGPANRGLISPMPRVYGIEKDKPNPIETHYQYFVGENTLFPTPLTKINVAAIPDGTSNTFLCAEAKQAVSWAKPADMAIQPNGPIPVKDGEFLALMADVTVRPLNRSKTNDAMLRIAIDPRDGRPVMLD